MRRRRLFSVAFATGLGFLVALVITRPLPASAWGMIFFPMTMALLGIPEALAALDKRQHRAATDTKDRRSA